MKGGHQRGRHKRALLPVPGPIKILSVDLAGPLPDIVATRPEGEPYTSAWLLVKRAGRPIDLVTMDFDGPVIRSEDVARRLDAALSSRPAPPRLPVRDDTLPAATVIITTIAARPDSLEATVASLQALDYPRFDIILVDNRPPGAPEEPLLVRLGSLPRVQVIRELRPGISAARNRGLEAAGGEIVAFSDDDVIVDREWLRSLAEALACDPDLALVGGLVLPKELETPAQRWFEDFYGGFNRDFRARVYKLNTPVEEDALFPYRPGKFGTGANIAARREVLRRVGGFDPLLGIGTPARGGEDLALFIHLLTAGYNIAVEPSAIIFHSHHRSEEALRRQVHNYGIGLTAMFTEIVWENPRHAVAMGKLLAANLPRLWSPRRSGTTASSPRTACPTDLRRQAWIGMAKGPFAYLHSRLAARTAGSSGETLQGSPGATSAVPAPLAPPSGHPSVTTEGAGWPALGQ